VCQIFGSLRRVQTYDPILANHGVIEVSNVQVNEALTARQAVLKSFGDVLTYGGHQWLVSLVSISANPFGG